jgi:hypothetical protein
MIYLIYYKVNFTKNNFIIKIDNYRYLHLYLIIIIYYGLLFITIYYYLLRFIIIYYCI